MCRGPDNKLLHQLFVVLQGDLAVHGADLEKGAGILLEPWLVGVRDHVFQKAVQQGAPAHAVTQDQLVLRTEASSPNIS